MPFLTCGNEKIYRVTLINAYILKGMMMAAYIVCQAFISVTCPLKNTMIPTRTVDGSMGGKYKFIQEI